MPTSMKLHWSGAVQSAAPFPVALFSLTMEASPRVYEPIFSLDDISITSSTTDNIPEIDSFIYNQSFASSDTSIASYKTERTVNSRKSRYNALPRHKYAGIGSMRRPQGLVSFDVDLPEVCRPIRCRNRHAYTRFRPNQGSSLQVLFVHWRRHCLFRILLSSQWHQSWSRKATQVPSWIPFQLHRRQPPFARIGKPLKLKKRTRLLMITRQVVSNLSLLWAVGLCFLISSCV